MFHGPHSKLLRSRCVRRFYRYTLIAGIPASHYTGTIEVRPNGSGCVVDWRVQCVANDQPDIVVKTMVSTLLKTGLGSLKLRFGATTSTRLWNVTISVHPRPTGRSPRSTWSARRRAWARFAQDARHPGVAEAIVDKERLAAQFLGDLDTLDRLDALASQFACEDGSFRAALVHAEVALIVHRFADARGHLARAELMGDPCEAIERHSLTIDQACCVELDAVLAARRRISAARGRLEDLVPLGAVLADLERGRCLSAGVVLLRRRFPVPSGVGLFSARYAVGRTRARTGPECCRALVSTRNCLLARLSESARAPGGDLREPRPNRRRGDATRASAWEPRSGGPVASCRRADRAREVRRS
jgi:hypothetical protein